MKSDVKNTKVTVCDRRFLAAIVIPLALVCLAHGWYLYGLIGDRALSDMDAAFYTLGARSISEFNISKKFNKERYPIVGQKRQILESDMPSYAKYVLAPYPNPSFKFGFSLTMALLTAPFSQGFLDHELQPTMVANFFLSLMSVALLGAIFWIVTESWLAVILPAIFWVFDPFFIYNNYYYGSHTTCGLVALLGAILVYLSSVTLHFTRMALISLLLAGSLLSSSHEVMMAFCFGLVLVASEMISVPWGHRIRILGGAMVGVFLPAGYILGVERWFEFKRLGIPRYFEQFSGYSAVVGNLIRTYPLKQRFLWDWRVDNLFFVPILFLAVLAIFVEFRSSGTQVKFGFLFDAICCSRLSKRATVIGVAMITAFVANAFYTQPVSRGAVPYILLFWAFLGWLVSRAVDRKRLFSWLALGTICLLQLTNYLIAFKFVDWPFVKAHPHIYQIDEYKPIRENSAYFFSNREVKHVPFNDVSDSIEGFVVKHMSKYQENSDLIVSFDAMTLAEAYSWTRRFIPAFVFSPDQAVTQTTILSDFNLINEIFRLCQKGVLQKDTIVRDSWRKWNVETWDQEYSYIYGYQGGIKRYLIGTPLENIDTRAMYYFKFSNLANYVEGEVRQVR